VSRAEALARIRDNYTGGVRRLAMRGIHGLARTRVSPNALTAAGVLLCAAAAVLVYFEYRDEYLFYWTGGAVFVVGSILDILDGALARTSGKGTPFGAFLDSTTDRISEGFVLGAIALVFSRHGNEVALAFAIAAIANASATSFPCREKTSAIAPRTNPSLIRSVVESRNAPNGVPLPLVRASAPSRMSRIEPTTNTAPPVQ